MVVGAVVVIAVIVAGVVGVVGVIGGAGERDELCVVASSGDVVFVDSLGGPATAGHGRHDCI